jgi:hypothetical protein
MSSAPPASLKRKRNPLPAPPTNRVSRSAAAAAADAADPAAPPTNGVSRSAAAAATADPAAPSTTNTPQRAARAAAAEEEEEEEEYHPAEALPPASKKASGAIMAFSQMRAARHADPRTSKTLELQRSSNREAYLAQCVGAVQIASCKSCSKGHGPWKGCVVVAGYLKESCANCHYNGEGQRCSFRPGKSNHFRV